MYNSAAILIIGICIFISDAYANVLRDPTKPPNIASQEVSGSELHIDAIFFNKNGINSSVIIGGHRFMVGDKVKAATIIEIKPNEIKLKEDNGEFTVTMSNSNIKSPTIKTNKKKTP
jgi:hypothetical protein